MSDAESMETSCIGDNAGDNAPNQSQMADTEGAKADDGASRDYYFDSYSRPAIHEDMLKDQVRTFTYRDAMYYNKHLFENKVVLDVGCGTGILSLFAAKAGAKCVIAVDCSDIVESARRIVADNKMADIIKVIKGKIEEVEMPEGIEKVDVIISEWMGYCLFYGAMLESVLFARDKWLKPDGIIFPDSGTLHIAAIEDRQSKDDKIDFWKNVYGFDLSCMRKIAISEPIVREVYPEQVVSSNFILKEVDLYTVKKEDLKFKTEFKLKIKRNDHVQALVTYFNIEFKKCHVRLGFSTSPEDKFTHWRQTVFFLDDFIIVNKGEKIRGTFEMKPNKHNHRDLDIDIGIKFNGEHSRVKEVNHYNMR